MENFIKESKSGFDFTSVSSHSRIVNANRLRYMHLLITYLIGLDDWRYLQICLNSVLMLFVDVAEVLLKIGSTVCIAVGRFYELSKVEKEQKTPEDFQG